MSQEGTWIWAISQGPDITLLCLCNSHCKQGETIDTINWMQPNRSFSNGDRNSTIAMNESTNEAPKHPFMFEFKHVGWLVLVYMEKYYSFWFCKKKTHT